MHSSRPAPSSSSPSPATTYDLSSLDVSKHSIKLTAKQRAWRRKDLAGQSLVSDTLQAMEVDTEFQRTLKELKTLGAKKMTLEEKKHRRRALSALGVADFRDFLPTAVPPPHDALSRRTAAAVLQLNIGLYCNQACGHCHVESSPRRQEQMSLATADRCLAVLAQSPEVTTLDITGGAPELNSAFRHLVRRARSLRPDLDVIDRCNLTVVHEPGQEDLIDFLAEHRVHIIASLPCYSSKNVNQQRGKGVFDRSISALVALNERGFGVAGHGEGLQLDLVYNPLGAFLPPPQDQLEDKYKEELEDNFGITFNHLFTMTNMPIKRFADFLHRRQELKDYMHLLVKNFNSATVDSLMCKNTVSVDYDGRIFDCDFNQQLGLHHRRTIFDIAALRDLADDPIAFDNHCYGCTAGMGSS